MLQAVRERRDAGRVPEFPECARWASPMTEFFGQIREEGAPIARPGFFSLGSANLSDRAGGANPDRNALALFKGFHRRRCDASRERYAVKKAIPGRARGWARDGPGSEGALPFAMSPT